MADTQDDTTVDLGGQARPLQFRIGDLREFQRRMGGVTLLEIGRRLDELDMEAIVIGLFLALRHADRRLTPQRVEEWLDGLLSEGKPVSDALGPLQRAFIKGAGIGGRRSEGPSQGEAGG